MPEAANALPDELQFLETFLADRRRPLRTADWLLSDFDDPVWRVRQQYPLQFAWSVPVGTSGLLLTSKRHEALWTVFRCWLLLQTDLAHNGGRVLTPISVYNRLRNVSVWIDYFLLHADRLALPEHGLMALSENDFKAALSVISSKASVLDSIYDWPQRSTDFLRQKIGCLTDCQLRRAIREQPLLALPAEAEESGTYLNPGEITKARAWLWINGFYSETSTSEYRHVVNAHRLAGEVYPSIVRRWGRFRSPEELALGPSHYCLREMPRASVVTSREDRLSKQRYEMYRSLLHSLGALEARGCAVPQVAGTGVDVARSALNLKPKGRYRSIPYDVVLYGMRRGVDFALEHGDHLVASFLAVAKQAHAENTTIAVLSQRNSIQVWLEPQTRQLGVQRWSIEATSAGSGVLTEAPTVLPRAAYYRALRGHEGLYECVRILYGAIQLVVGVLMARRQGELRDLPADDCLDESRTRLVFRNRKSGTLGFRTLEARPIPPLGVRLLGILQKLHIGLAEAGLIEHMPPLFASPAWLDDKWLNAASSYSYNLALDLFCDYAEIPCTASGERYYFRQHQLRRFFAMAFFWCSGLDHLDTLRWFLGHTDMAHLYHYITTETPGNVLRGVKAEWAADAIARDAPETGALAAFLLEVYGTDQFQLLDQQALTMHIDDLIEDGCVHIEPEFLDPGGNYRILVTVAIREERQ